jgi:hypothetical protein
LTDRPSTFGVKLKTTFETGTEPLTDDVTENDKSIEKYSSSYTDGMIAEP